MSDIPANYRERLDLREQIVRIDRALDEAAKFRAERDKLTSEGRKLDRERWFAPALAIASVLGGLLGVATFIAHLMGH